MEENKSLFGRIMRKLWHEIWATFLNGLLTLLPFTLTIALFTFTFRFFRGWLEPVYQLEPESLRAIPGSQFWVVLLIIFCTGAIIRLFFLEPLVHAIERVFFKIPLMSQVYGGIKQLVQAFSVQDELAFKNVVMIPFPSETTYSLGFLTSEVPVHITNATEKYFNVFVPTTPNPTSGFLVQVPESEMKIINLSRQEAMTLIISGGLIRPERFM